MRIRACALALLVLAAPALSYAANVSAQSGSDALTEVARQRFREGVRLYDQGKYEEARAAFLQAFALKKHPSVLLNLAQSELRSDHPVEAARHFSEFLRDNPGADAAEIRAARDGLTAARVKTGQLDVKVDVVGADIFVDGELVGRSPLPTTVDVAPGARKVEVRMPGQPLKSQDVNAGIGKVTVVTVSLGAPTAPTPTSTTAPTPAPAPAPTPAPAREPSVEAAEEGSHSVTTEGRQPFFEWLMEDKVAWATGGATVVGLGVGVVFALAARTASNNADNVAGTIKAVAERDEGLRNYQGLDRTKNPCADPIPITSSTDYSPSCHQLLDNLDKRGTDKTLSIVGFVLAGVGATGTGILYFVRSKPAQDGTSTADREAPRPMTMIAPVIAPQMRGLAIGGSF